MAFTIIDASGPVISAKISGELGKSEVTQIQAAAVTFMTEHDQEITKIAVVGEEQWRDLVFAFLAKGFRQAEVEYFLPGDLAKARAWLGADSP